MYVIAYSNLFLCYFCMLNICLEFVFVFFLLARPNTENGNIHTVRQNCTSFCNPRKSFVPLGDNNDFLAGNSGEDQARINNIRQRKISKK